MLKSQGFFKAQQKISSSKIDSLLECIEQIKPNHSYPKSIRYRKNKLYAIRNLIQISSPIKDILSDTIIKNICRGSVIIHSLLFDKITEANFRVPFHQDIVMPHHGADKIVTNVPHKNLPPEILEQLIVMRIHLDDNNIDNGPLQVIPQTHSQGIISDKGISNIVQKKNKHVCTMLRGEILLMKPLLLHSSNRSSSHKHRRVIHLVFAPRSLQIPWFFSESL
ncbi:phytanoyl-CoA dioxygenase family protein [Candidatus Uabimicrobium sp. HlEnr_7]|uniref:phytanoyl-CoA dioxygenase family protein n=1 Tax=Candidatus Uabimicrobium helgolandensis TaxID=3095367 RepID=UPI003555E6F9